MRLTTYSNYEFDLPDGTRLAVNALNASKWIQGLIADAERLDWLQEHWDDGIMCKNERGFLPYHTDVDYQPPLRAVIDAVKAAAARDKEKKK